VNDKMPHFGARLDYLSRWRERSARAARGVRVAGLRSAIFPIYRSCSSSLKRPAVGVLPPPQRMHAMRFNASRQRMCLDVAPRATSVFH